jgi:ATP-binding cassette subfamily C protein
MKIVAAGFIVLIYMSFSFYISYQLTAVAVALFLAGNQGFKILNRKSFVLGNSIMALNNRLHSMIVEIFSGAKFIKQSAIEENVTDEFSSLSDKLCATQIKSQMNQAKMTVILEPFVIGFICFYFYVSVAILYLDMSSVMVFIFIFYRLYPKVSFINELINGVLGTIPSYTNILKVKERMAGHQRKGGGEKTFDRLESEIRLNDLHFSYRRGKKVLEGIDVSLKKNQITALVGGSGSGKTTILDLLTGLFLPDSGAILVDDTDLNEYSMKAWRSRISYVDQVPILFHDTINSNIRMMNPCATDEDVLEAAKQAHAWEFIKDLPDGLETVIGDRGVRLSGGQKQRLVLARALTRKPDILVLDEATSALDTHSESLIRETIENLRGKMTIIVVAHRLSTIKNADMIYVIEHGKVVEEGPYQELVERGNVLARYHSLS